MVCGDRRKLELMRQVYIYRYKCQTVESRDRGPTRRTGGELKQEKPTAVVTGTAQGIGRRTAELLAERGYRVALNDLRMPDETLRSIQSRGGEAMSHVGNIVDESIVEELVRAVFEAWGRADVLVNNAGISLIAPAEKTSASDYRRVLEVNLVA